MRPTAHVGPEPFAQKTPTPENGTVTREDAAALAERRTAADRAGHWFARKRKDGQWQVVRVEAPFSKVGETHASQEPKRGSGPDPAPSLPGGVSPWAAGS